MKKHMNKKGLLPLLAVLANPYVLLGVGIFIILLLLGVFFALKTLLAVAMVLAGLAGWFKGLNPYIAGVLFIVGILLLWNPFEAFDFLMIHTGDIIGG